VEEQLEHQLGPEVADVLDGGIAPVSERVRPRRVAARVVLAGPSSLVAVPLVSTRPASRS
jgi:hypothetical protein